MMFEDEDDRLDEADKYLNRQPRMAITIYRDYLKDNPTHWMIWFNLGCQYAMLESDRDAMDCYEEALKYTPEEQDLEGRGEYEEYILREAVSSIHFNRGQIFLREGKLAYALESYKTSIDWLASPDAYDAMSIIYWDLGQPLKAMATHYSNEHTS